MLKSGKLKLADDMIVTAQEAANKAETVFTIYDDVTNTEIASGPIGGGGGGESGDIILNYTFEDSYAATIEPVTSLIKSYQSVEEFDRKFYITWNTAVFVTFKTEAPETALVEAYLDDGKTPFAGGAAQVQGSGARVVLQTTDTDIEITKGTHQVRIILGDK